MASGLKSDNSNLVLNADGAGNKVVIQENGIDSVTIGTSPTTSATGVIVKSPNSTLYMIKVSDTGAVEVEAL